MDDKLINRLMVGTLFAAMVAIAFGMMLLVVTFLRPPSDPAHCSCPYCSRTGSLPTGQVGAVNGRK